MATREFSKLSWLKNASGLNITPAEFRVLVTIFNYTDENGRNGRPGRANLIADTRLTEKHVRTCVRRLEAVGLIVVTGEGGRDNGRPTARTWALGDPTESVLSTEKPVLSTDSEMSDSVLSTDESVLSTAKSVLSTAESVLSTPLSDQIRSRSDQDQINAREAAPVVQGVVVPDEDDVDPDAEARELAEHLADVIGSYASQRPTPTRKWIAAFTDLMSRENITRQQVEYVIDYLPDDNYWPAFVFDAPYFVNKYDRIAGKARNRLRERMEPTRTRKQQENDEQQARWAARYGTPTNPFADTQKAIGA